MHVPHLPEIVHTASHALRYMQAHAPHLPHVGVALLKAKAVIAGGIHASREKAALLLGGKRGIVLASATAAMLGGTVATQETTVRPQPGHYARTDLSMKRTTEHHFDPTLQMEIQCHLCLDDIYTNGFQRHVDTVLTPAERASLFYRDDGRLPKCLCCVDEGIPHIKDAIAVHFAGAGILNMNAPTSFDPRNPEYVRQIARQNIRNGIMILSQHGDTDDGSCGAAFEATRIMLGLSKDDMGKMDASQRQEFAKQAVALNAEWLQMVQQEMTIQLTADGKSDLAGQVQIMRIPGSEMHRPAHAHNASVIYLDETGLYVGGSQLDEDGHVIDGCFKMPPGFTVTVDAAGQDAVANAALCKAIAFGPHGFNSALNASHPLILAHIRFDGQPANAEFESRIAAMIAGLTPEERARIRVETVVFPEPGRESITADHVQNPNLH